MIIYGRNINMRAVRIEDTEFIYTLRQNQDKTKYLSTIIRTVALKKEWIKNCRVREEDKKEFYFVIESKDK